MVRVFLEMLGGLATMFMVVEAVTAVEVALVVAVTVSMVAVVGL